MEDPVVAADGQTYERAAITQWLESGNRNSPLTGERLRHDDLTPNHRLKAIIQAYRESLPQIERERQIMADLDMAVRLREEMFNEHLTKTASEARAPVGPVAVAPQSMLLGFSASASAASSAAATAAATAAHQSTSSSAVSASASPPHVVPMPVPTRPPVAEINAFIKLVAEGEQDRADAMLRTNRALVLFPGRLRRAPRETFWDIRVDQNVLGGATSIFDAADIPVRELLLTRNSLLG